MQEIFPAWTIVQAAHVVTRAFTAVFAEVDLTPTQFGVLAYLAEDDALTQAQLARHVLVRPQTMGELLGSLLDRGLIRRDGPGGRGRRTAITITDAGRQVLSVALPGARDLNGADALGLTSAQRRTLDELLHVVSRTVAARYG